MKKLLLSLFLAALPCWAVAEPLPPVAKEFLTGWQTLSARFVQTTPAQGLVLEGQLLVQRPGKLAWRYDSGERLVRRDGLTFWDDGNGNLTQLPDRLGLASLLVKDVPEAPEGFELVVEQEEGHTTLIFTATNPADSGVQQLNMTFSAPDNRLQQLQTVDQLGQLTIVNFDGWQKNEKLDEAPFKLNIPLFFN